MLLLRPRAVNEIKSSTLTCSLCFLCFPIISTCSTLLLWFPIPKTEKNRKMGEENYPSEEADQYFGEFLTYSKVWYKPPGLLNKRTQPCPRPHESCHLQSIRCYIKIVPSWKNVMLYIGAVRDPNKCDLQSPTYNWTGKISTYTPSPTANGYQTNCKGYSTWPSWTVVCVLRGSKKHWSCVLLLTSLLSGFPCWVKY